MLRWLLPFLLVLPVHGQSTAKPEPRHRVSVEPLVIFRNLLEASEQKRAVGFRQLGWASSRFVPHAPTVSDARLLMVQFDDDEPLEALLIFALDDREADAIVLDGENGTWWSVGEFDDHYHWFSGHIDQFIELREIAAPGRKDIIVRVRGGGSGSQTTELTVYRMLNGRLFRVFQTTERAGYDTSGPGYHGSWYAEQRLLFYPEHREGTPSVIVLHGTKANCEVSPQPRYVSSTCSVYSWSAPHFAFERDREAEAKYCNAKTHAPNLDLASGCAQY